MGCVTEHSEEQVVFLGEFREDVFAVVKAQMKGRKNDKPVDVLFTLTVNFKLK